MIQTVKLQKSGYLVNGNMSVPNDQANTDYQMVQEWLKNNTPEPEDIISTQVESITKVQAMRYLKSINKWTDFQTILSSNIDAKDEWDLALSLDLNDQFTQSLAPALGIDLNTAFNEASVL